MTYEVWLWLAMGAVRCSGKVDTANQVELISFNDAYAVSMRSLNSSAFKPPTGCLTMIILGSTLRASA